MINLLDIFLNDSFNLSQRIIKVGIDNGIEREIAESLEDILKSRLGCLNDRDDSSFQKEDSIMLTKISQSLKIK